MNTNKIMSAEAPSDIGERMIRFCASNEEEDRDGDILLAEGCNFKNFAKNPQFLGFHNYHDYPLGTPKKWFIDRATKKVYIDVYFPTIEELSGGKPENASEKAKLVDTTYHMYKTKMLNAVSVGFKILEAAKNAASSTMWGQVISKWEIIELSAVPVPANQGALAEAMKSFDPSGRMLEIFTEDVPAPDGEKSGRRISASTMATIEEMKKCNDSIKACHKEMNGHMEMFDSLVEKLIGEEPEETEEDPDVVIEIE
jgi:hypothetical protein